MYGLQFFQPQNQYLLFPLTHVVNFFLPLTCLAFLRFTLISPFAVSSKSDTTTFCSVLWFLFTAVPPTIDKLSCSVVYVVLISLCWYFDFCDLGGGCSVFAFNLMVSNTVGDGLYCIFDYYPVVLHYQMSFPHLTESSPLDAAVARLYCALEYYSVLFYYQIITLVELVLGSWELWPKIAIFIFSDFQIIYYSLIVLSVSYFFWADLLVP